MVVCKKYQIGRQFSHYFEVNTVIVFLIYLKAFKFVLKALLAWGKVRRVIYSCFQNMKQTSRSEQNPTIDLKRGQWARSVNWYWCVPVFWSKKNERSTLSRLISNLPKVDNHLMGFCYENVKIWYERALPSCEATKTRMYIPTCVKRRINKIAHCLYPRHWIAEERSMSHLKGYSSKQRVVFMLFNRKEK